MRFTKTFKPKFDQAVFHWSRLFTQRRIRNLSVYLNVESCWMHIKWRTIFHRLQWLRHVMLYVWMISDHKIMSSSLKEWKWKLNYEEEVKEKLRWIDDVEDSEKILWFHNCKDQSQELVWHFLDEATPTHLICAMPLDWILSVDTTTNFNLLSKQSL